MTAVILAAGTATRLHPLTEELPKALLPVGGVPLLERALESLGRHGIRETVVVTGHGRDAVKRFLASLPGAIRVTEVFNPLFAASWMEESGVVGGPVRWKPDHPALRPARW